MRRHDLRIGVDQITVVHRWLCSHHLIEHVPVLVHVSEFQRTLVSVHEDRIVVGETGQLASELDLARVDQERAHRIGQQLQGRQPLTIDHVPSDESCDLRLVGLQDYSPEEVTHVEVWLGDPAFGNSADVLPQRLPLLLFAPHVGTLEQRDDEVLWQVEQLQRCPFEGLHEPILPQAPVPCCGAALRSQQDGQWT